MEYFSLRKKKALMYRKEIFWDYTYWILLIMVRNQMQTAVNKVKTHRFCKIFDIS